jgi:putative tryptophan/tyrosine transport system substrate-binding protein
MCNCKKIFCLLISFLTTLGAYSSPCQAWIAFIAPDRPREREIMHELATTVKKQQVNAHQDIIFVPVDYTSAEPLVEQIREKTRSAPSIMLGVSAAIALAAQKAHPHIPLIFASQQDPVAIGLVDKLSHRTKKATGITFFLPIHRTQLQLLLTTKDSIRRVGMVGDKGWLESPGLRDELVSLSMTMGIKPHFYLLERDALLSSVINQKSAKEVDAWFIPATPATVERIQETVDLINLHKKPAIFGLTEYTKRGGLISYQAKLDPPTIVLAQMVVSVLSGTPVESIPIDRPRHFELSINAETFKQLSLPIPLTVRDRVNNVFN